MKSKAYEANMFKPTTRQTGHCNLEDWTANQLLRSTQLRTCATQTASSIRTRVARCVSQKYWPFCQHWQI